MILEPPDIYLKPYQPLKEIIKKAPEVDRLCRQAGAKYPFQIIGCSFKILDYCFIIISDHAVEPLRRHEIAHCQGWIHE